MQQVVKIAEHGMPVLKVSSEGKASLEFDLLDFFRNKENLDTMYEHTNLYLRSLPLEVQNTLHDVFEEVDRYVNANSFDDIKTVKFLQAKLEIAMGLFDLNSWRLFFRTKAGDLHIPDTVKDDFTEDTDMGITREKTYVTSEYIDLIGFILFIRAMSPIYVDYLRHSKISSKHPFYLVFRLFMGSAIDVPETELGKLRSYIEINYIGLIGGTGRNEHLIIAAGLSDDDIVDYLIAEVIFNKLLTIEFFKYPCNAVSYIFNTIRYKGNFRTSESSKLRASSSGGGGGEMEDYSYFEDYRKTTSIPIGTVVEIQHALSDPYKLAANLGLTDFDFDLYEKELKYVTELSKEPPATIQIYLLGWFLHRVINPRALFHIEARKIVELLIFTKVALLKTEQVFIGIFLTSVRGDQDQYLNIMIRNTLNRSLIEGLRDKFKFVMGEERGSIIEKIISETGKEMTNSVWKPVGSLGGVKGLLTKEGYIDMASNVNDLVTNYVGYVLEN